MPDPRTTAAELQEIAKLQRNVLARLQRLQDQQGDIAEVHLKDVCRRLLDMCSSLEQLAEALGISAGGSPGVSPPKGPPEGGGLPDDL